MTESPERQPPLERLITVRDAAQALCVSRAHLYRLIDAGIVPAIRLGTSLRLRRADVIRIIAEGIPTSQI